MPPPATALMDPQLDPERREPALQRADHARGDPRRVPVHSHNGPERLEPEGVGETPQQLIAPVVMDNCLADHRAQAGHPVCEPLRDMSAVQRKIGSPSSSSHQSSCLSLNFHCPPFKCRPPRHAAITACLLLGVGYSRASGGCPHSMICIARVVTPSPSCGGSPAIRAPVWPACRYGG